MNETDAAPRRSYGDCTEVGPYCPVEATVLGYTPNLGASIFFTIAFALLLIVNSFFSVRHRTWTYAAGLTCGLILETAGYVGRALMHSNPWDSGAFQLQICAIILGPTFICVSIYLTLKHACLALTPGNGDGTGTLSRFNPKWYPRIFLPADLSCLIVQAIGGGIAAAAGKTDQKLLEGGNNAIIAGVALQVAVLIVFGALGVDYFLRVRKYMRSGAADPRGLAVWRDGKFRKFGVAVMGAYAVILVRCIYRIAEMAGGWGNHIMQDEISFYILDPTLVLICAALLTAFHPGIFFPRMCNGEKGRQAIEKNEAAAGVSAESSGPEGSVEPKP